MNQLKRGELLYNILEERLLKIMNVHVSNSCSRELYDKSWEDKKLRFTLMRNVGRSINVSGMEHFF